MKSTMGLLRSFFRGTTMDGDLDNRYHHYLGLAREKGKEKEYERAYLTYKAQGTCRREAIELAAWFLNLPGQPW
jgi:hypothetical protein